MACKSFWSKEEEDVLRQLSLAGRSIDEAVLVLVSRTKEAISNKAYGMGLSMAGPSPEIDMAEFKRLIKAGRK
jgi:hypothetical protein